MSPRLRGLAAVAVGLALTAAPALSGAANASAEDPPVVIVNTSQPGPYTYVATSKDGVNFSIDGNDLPCDTATLFGDIGSGVPVADVTGSEWDGCIFESLPMEVSPNRPSIWQIRALSGYTSAPDDHHIVGSVDGFSLDVSILGGVCTFSITGSLTINIDEDFIEPDGTHVQQITIPGSVVPLSDPSIGCVGVAGDGDPVTITATFNVQTFDSTGAPITDNPTPINIS